MCVFFVINNVGLGVCGVVLICIRSSLISIIKKTVILISYICFFMSAGMASGVTWRAGADFGKELVNGILSQGGYKRLQINGP